MFSYDLEIVKSNSGYSLTYNDRIVCTAAGKIKITENSPVSIIAEIGINHSGSLIHCLDSDLREEVNYLFIFSFLVSFSFKTKKIKHNAFVLICRA